METVIVENSKYKRAYIASLLGILLFYSGIWLFNITLPAFLSGLLWGIALGGFIVGFFTLRFPSIIINENGIFTKNSNWDQSFKWADLRDVALHKNRISVTFQKTGAGDTIRIPFLLRRKIPQIHEAITHHCSYSGVNFSSIQTKEREGFHAV